MPEFPLLLVCIVCEKPPPEDAGWTLYVECSHLVCASCEGRPGRKRARRERCPVCTGQPRRPPRMRTR